MGGDVLSQRDAWMAYDRMRSDSRVGFISDPAGVETEFRRLSYSDQPSTKLWSDAYLAAVASTAELTIATLDRGFLKFKGVDVRCLLAD
jgi:predicted nucleic acid-binding protein